MKKLVLLTLLVGLMNFSQAQIKSVAFDVVANQINSGVALPAEEPFYIRGSLPRGIEYVKVRVNRPNKGLKQADTYEWKRAFDYEVNQYELFIGEPLKSNTNYDFEFTFYERASEEQMQEVKESISSNLSSYIRANFEVTASGIRSSNSDQVMITQMNQIVENGLEDYRHFLGRDFSGFSDLVRQKLDQRNKLKLRRARFNILGKAEKDNDKAAYANKYISELEEAVENELNQYLSRSLMSLVDVRYISSYPTERKPGVLPLNFGYGAFAVKRHLSSTEYFNGPYVGLSLPLGNKTFKRFLGNASFSTGVFLQNFNASSGERISGPIVNLPIYAGLGYKLFNVMRFNAGAVLINMDDSNMNTRTDYIQPYVGMSLELNLWLGFNNRR
ncbi:hypothetical protein ACFOUP_11545 [Belliella kenyensis]|uniref:Outer membrane protein beta-barrel domain-containing protein n=1 Tax=Belliella kenyensis TaxID=1472724 RepID=A0ABV8EL33_9BACT|nr:hypothetical protein [Belliella kenyensis]MCH7400596.1 hypothetical protein [Belliella kenyensis]MDN3602117.1 hypothetical protein [Belliella kenyensis]